MASKRNRNHPKYENESNDVSQSNFVSPRKGRHPPQSIKIIKLDPEQQAAILKAKVDEILAIELGFNFVGQAKEHAIRLVNEMQSHTNVPAREERTRNYFPVFMGRLNPPHKFHLISLITAILIARANGTRALFLLGNGGGPSRSDPLTFEIKSNFIASKLHNFGFVRSTLDVVGDYTIDVQRASVSQIHDFIRNEYISEYGDVILFRIGGISHTKLKTVLYWM